MKGEASKLKITLKIGGHAFPNQPDLKKIAAYTTTIKNHWKKGCSFLVVTGGGETARRYIKIARMLGADETVCDQIGIEVSRLNARLIISKLGELAYPEVPTTLEDVRKVYSLGKIVVMGGLTPGHSTTAVGSLAAEATGSDLYIIASNVDGIYTCDPKKYRNAKKLKKITTKKMIELALSEKYQAGTYALDPISIKVMERSKIHARFINGENLRNLDKAIKGENIGTLIAAK
ncbi:MAG: UMP kinase [Candidatus Bathyarchaeota archaeon]